jgi:hypothetical protein
MDYEELLDYLGLEDPSEFEYFENFAELIEGHETISTGALYRLLKGIPEGVMAEVMEGYFNEAQEACPDTEADLYTLLEMIKKVLIGLSESIEDDRDWAYLADEILRFKEWYINESQVVIKSPKKGEERQVTVMEALAISRLEKLEGEEYDYDFSLAKEYPLDEHIMVYSVKEMEEEDSEEDEGYQEDIEE